MNRLILAFLSIYILCGFIQKIDYKKREDMIMNSFNKQVKIENGLVPWASGGNTTNEIVRIKLITINILMLTSPTQDEYLSKPLKNC